MEQACPPVVIDADRSFVLDLRLSRVEGQLTVNGNTMPTGGISGEGQGSIVFVRHDTQDRYQLPLAGGRYAGQIMNGRYAVQYQGNERLEDVGGILVSHSQLALLEPDLVVEGALARDYDVPVFMVSAEVLLNGRAMPENGVNGDGRGSITFRRRDTGDDYKVSLPNAGDAGFLIPLIGGEYDLLEDDNVEIRGNQLHAQQRRICE